MLRREMLGAASHCYGESVDSKSSGAKHSFPCTAIRTTGSMCFPDSDFKKRSASAGAASFINKSTEFMKGGQHDSCFSFL